MGTSDRRIRRFIGTMPVGTDFRGFLFFLLVLFDVMRPQSD